MFATMVFMAQKTQTILTDDIDGSEAASTVTFAYQGTSYEIDLSDQHATQLVAALADWIGAARKVPARGSAGRLRIGAARGAAGPKRTDLEEVRAWARAHGHTVADTGRVKQTVLDAYDNR